MLSEGTKWSYRYEATYLVDKNLQRTNPKLGRASASRTSNLAQYWQDCTRNKNAIKYELFGCVPGCFNPDGILAVFMSCHGATLQQRWRLQEVSTIKTILSLELEWYRKKRDVRCIIDCVPKVELLENVSFGSDPDGSELQTAHLPSNRLWSHGSTYERLGLNYNMLHIAWECQSECSQNKHIDESKHCSLNSSTISNTHETT